MATGTTKVYRIEVIEYGPEGVVQRLQSCATTAELAGTAMGGVKEMMDELGKDTEAAEQAATE